MPLGCCVFFFFPESAALPSITPFGCCFLFFFPLPGDCSIDYGDMDDVRNTTFIGYKLKNIISSNVSSIPLEKIDDQKNESFVYPQILHGLASILYITETPKLTNYIIQIQRNTIEKCRYTSTCPPFRQLFTNVTVENYNSPM